jgi:hypothetical protein
MYIYSLCLFYYFKKGAIIFIISCLCNSRIEIIHSSSASWSVLGRVVHCQKYERKRTWPSLYCKMHKRTFLTFIFVQAISLCRWDAISRLINLMKTIVVYAYLECILLLQEKLMRWDDEVKSECMYTWKWILF